MDNKFEIIYKTLKKEIIDGIYNDTMKLPTEAVLVKRFDTSRNTIRRSIQCLNEDGLVYSVKGRGVVILENTRVDEMFFKMGNFQGLKALSSYANVKTATKIRVFEELTVDEKLSKRISFPIGERVFHADRIRLINDRATMHDNSYFKKSIVKGLNKDIAKESIYNYINENLDFNIAASKTVTKVESANKIDSEVLDLGKNNCVGVVENAVYTDMGKLFEHTTIRYIPNEYAIVSFNQSDKDRVDHL